MPRIAALALAGMLALLGLASSASAAAISNGTVRLGVNPQGDLNSEEGGPDPLGVTYIPTGFDGTRKGFPAEGWGAGAGGPVPFVGRANEWIGNSGYLQVSFAPSASSAVSVVNILRGGVPALRLTQDFHSSPTTPNLYEITTTLTNITDAPLTDVRYERVMDWDVEPTEFNEFVTVNRGPVPPDNLLYSDDDGFSDNDPFTADNSGSTHDPATENVNYVDKGPADHGARFTFGFGDLGPGESKEFFVYYGAAGNEDDADAAVSSAALEVFSYGQPNTPDGPTLGTPNTFIWGFRGVGGAPVFPPTLDLFPKSASSNTGSTHTVNGTLTSNDGSPVPGAEIVYRTSGANSAGGRATTDADGQTNFSYTGTNAGDDTITACLDSNSNGACDAGEVSDTATKHWVGPSGPPPPSFPPPVTPAGLAPVLGKSVVAGRVSGKVRVRRKGGKFRTLGANQSIPLGSTVDATKGKVRLTSAAGPGGATQTGVFYQGQFVVTQTRGSKPITQLALNAKVSCGKAKKASTSARKKKVRRLWGDGKGRFRTRGKHGAATVKGTKWLTEDRCNGTLFRVKRGVVSVRDFKKKKTVLVKKGKSYLARK
jgi:hypothetical protein